MPHPNHEIEIELIGRRYTLKPSFEVIAAIEAATGKGAFALGSRLVNGEAGIAELATILYQALKRQGGPRYEAIGEALVERGAEPFLGPLANLLLTAFRGHRETADLAAGQPAEASGDPLP